MSKEKDKKEPSVIYPSVFGSHASMINKEKTTLLNDATKVVCTDEHGDYVTLKERLDNGCADPNRYMTARLNKLFNVQSKEEAAKK